MSRAEKRRLRQQPLLAARTRRVRAKAQEAAQRAMVGGVVEAVVMEPAGRRRRGRARGFQQSDLSRARTKAGQRLWRQAQEQRRTDQMAEALGQSSGVGRIAEAG